MDKDLDIVYDKRLQDYRFASITNIKYYIYKFVWLRVPRWYFYKCKAEMYTKKLVVNHKRGLFDNFFRKGKHDFFNDKNTVGKHDKESVR